MPWTMRASAPAAAAPCASSTSVTVTQTVLPTRLQARDDVRGRAAEGEGDGGHRVVLEQHELGVPRVVLEVRLAERHALAPRLVAQRLEVALVAAARGGATGTKTLTPKGAPVSARVALMSSRSA